jgi:hypothetical protein
METLGWIALALGAASLLRTLAALPVYLAWLRRGRVRDFAPGPTPPISIVVAGAPEPFLRQNYPEYEVIATADAEADIEVRTSGAPRYGIVVRANPCLEPDPLFLRDVAADGEVAFLPVLRAAKTLDAKLRALSANTDAVLDALLLGARHAGGAAQTTEPETIARRPAPVAEEGIGWGDLRRVFAVPLAAAPLLLVVCVPSRPGALSMLIAIALLRIGIAISMELRYVRDGTTLAALPWLPLLWLVEPWLLLCGRRRSATLGLR